MRRMMPTPSSKKKQEVKYIVIHQHNGEGMAFDSKIEAESFIADYAETNDDTEFDVFVGHRVDFKKETKISIEE